jgi:hypothetical protein
MIGEMHEHGLGNMLRDFIEMEDPNLIAQSLQYVALMAQGWDEDELGRAILTEMLSCGGIEDLHELAGGDNPEVAELADSLLMLSEEAPNDTVVLWD